MKEEFERIRERVHQEFTWLYGTTCDQCGSNATIQYTIWSDVVQCGRCSEDLVLWDVAFDESTGMVRECFRCTACGKEQRKRETRWVYATPVLTNYVCPQCKRTHKEKRGEHPTTAQERRRIEEIEAKVIPYWYPTTRFDQSWEMWRGVHKVRQMSDISKFYTHRNLWAMSRLWSEAQSIADPRLKNAFEFILTSLSQKHATIMTAIILKGGKRPVLTGNQPGTLYVPSFSAEKNLWEVFERKFADACKFTDVVMPTYRGEASVRTGSATHLEEIPSNSVDYVFTDPPFGSNIFYADCNFIWEAWLNQGFTDQTHEAVVHVKHKDKNTLPDYARLMTDSFREMYRVLKPGRWASVVFHNSDDKIWQTILDAVQAAGLELAQINSFDKEQLSFKGIRGDKGLERVTNKDIVLNLQKPGPKTSRAVNGTSAARNGDAEVRVVQSIAEFLASSPVLNERTLQHFWNVVLHDMIANGAVQVSMEQVGNMLPYYFKQVDEHWYLRGEAVVGGNVFDLKTDAGAIAWLSAVLTTPQTTGELIPQWQAQTAQAGGDTAPGRLERLLQQNFWLDKKTGHWRQPTAEERERMLATQDVAAEAHLRVVRRFLSGQSDHRPSNRELAEWVRFCYRHDAPAEAVALYAHVDESQLEAEYAKELRKIIAVCRIKTGQMNEG